MSTDLILKFVTQSEQIKLRPLKGLAALLGCQTERVDDLNCLDQGPAEGDYLVIIDATIPLEPENIVKLPNGFRYILIRSRTKARYNKWFEAYEKNPAVEALIFTDSASFLLDPHIILTIKGVASRTCKEMITRSLGWGHLRKKYADLGKLMSGLESMEIDHHLAEQINLSLTQFSKWVRRTTSSLAFQHLCDGSWLLCVADWVVGEGEDYEATLKQMLDMYCKSNGSVSLLINQIDTHAFQVVWISTINAPMASCATILCRTASHR